MKFFCCNWQSRFVCSIDNISFMPILAGIDSKVEWDRILTRSHWLHDSTSPTSVGIGADLQDPSCYVPTYTVSNLSLQLQSTTRTRYGPFQCDMSFLHSFRVETNSGNGTVGLSVIVQPTISSNMNHKYKPHILYCELGSLHDISTDPSHPSSLLEQKRERESRYIRPAPATARISLHSADQPWWHPSPSP